MPDKHIDDASRLVHAGRDSEAWQGVVNPPVYHASTVLFPTLAELKRAHAQRYNTTYYGRYGTPTHFAFEDAVCVLEGGHRAITTSSGLAAIHIALISQLAVGDHLLVTDNVYAPTRLLCDGLLTNMGITTTYFDPLDTQALGDKITGKTKVIFLESPGSLTFEVCDVPTISNMAKAKGITTILDNTWATPLFFKGLAHGVDIVLHAATKYIVGHADAMLGVLVCHEGSWRKVKDTAIATGQCAGPDDVYLGLRGLRSMGARLAQHQSNALALCQWLQQQPQVSRVMYPALSEDPGYSFWQRDFTGASGLFGLVLKPCSHAALAAMLDGLSLFGMGYSWGGYESLILPSDLSNIRTASRWQDEGVCLRVHAGLESVDDLIADLQAGFERLERDT